MNVNWASTPIHCAKRSPNRSKNKKKPKDKDNTVKQTSKALSQTMNNYNMFCYKKHYKQVYSIVTIISLPIHLKLMIQLKQTVISVKYKHFWLISSNINNNIVFAF